MVLLSIVRVRSLTPPPLPLLPRSHPALSCLAQVNIRSVQRLLAPPALLKTPIRVGTFADEGTAARAFDRLCRACGVLERELNFPATPPRLPPPAAGAPPVRGRARGALARRSHYPLAGGDVVRARYAADGRWYGAVIESVREDGAVVLRYEIKRVKRRRWAVFGITWGGNDACVCL